MNVPILNVVMLKVTMLHVIILNVTMLSVLSPKNIRAKNFQISSHQKMDARIFEDCGFGGFTLIMQEANKEGSSDVFTTISFLVTYE